MNSWRTRSGPPGLNPPMLSMVDQADRPRLVGRDRQVRVRRTREVGQQRHGGRARVGVEVVPVLEVEGGEGVDNGHRPGGRAEPEDRLAVVRAGPVAGVVLDDEGQAVADRAGVEPASGCIWKVNVVEKSWMFTRPLAKRLPACWPPSVVRSAAAPLNVATPVAVRSPLLAKPPEWSMRVWPPLE